MQYAYTAKSTTGQTSTGVLSTSSLAQLQRLLSEQGLFLLSAKAQSDSRPQSRPSPIFFRRSKVSKADLLTLTTQMAILSRAGVDLAGALEMVAKESTSPALRATLEKVHERVSAGESVAAALRSQGHVFGDAYVASVAAGEASGKLPEVFHRLAQLLRGEMKLRSTIRTLLAYPVLLVSVCGMVMIALMFFVLPQFAGVFQQLELPLPAMTQVLLAISDELRSRCWLWGGLLAAAIAGIISLRSSTTGRLWWDRMALNLVLVRDVTRALFVGRTLRLLGTMLESGVPLLESLQLTRSSVNNSQYRNLFDSLRESVLNGRAMGEVLRDSPFVPAAAAQMVLTAERTGTTGPVMQMMGEHYEEEGQTRLRELATILEPAIVVVMGVIVAFVVMSLFLPLFDFATLARQGA